MKGLTERIAELCLQSRFEDLPEDVLVKARMSVIDNMGCAIRGVREPVTQLIGHELFDRDITGQHIIPCGLPETRAVDRAMLYGVPCTCDRF